MFCVTCGTAMDYAGDNVIHPMELHWCPKCGTLCQVTKAKLTWNAPKLLLKLILEDKITVDYITRPPGSASGDTGNSRQSSRQPRAAGEASGQGPADSNVAP